LFVLYIAYTLLPKSFKNNECLQSLKDGSYFHVFFNTTVPCRRWKLSYTRRSVKIVSGTYLTTQGLIQTNANYAEC